MLSLSKHLACGSNQYDCNEASEMLRLRGRQMSMTFWGILDNITE